MFHKRVALMILGGGWLAVSSAACATRPATTVPTASQSGATPTETVTAIAATATITPTVISSASGTSTPRPTLAPDAWKSLPVEPTFDAHALQIYQQGLALGRNPHVFSKIGDCQNITTYFLADFEDPSKYRLGQYSNLQPTIDWFKGSFGRKSLAVHGGMSVVMVLSPLWADPTACQTDEHPLACEIRVNNPSIVIISEEEAWSGDVAKYGTYLRQVIEYTLSQGVVPIVATKADDLEGGNRIDALIAEVAWEYDIPLWNFWESVQWLTTHGLSIQNSDYFHLSQAKDYKNYYFDLPPANWSGWMERNLTALQALDAARRELNLPAAP